MILAAITINLTLGENGLITKAKIAKNAQVQAAEYETIELAKFECLDDEGNLDGTALKTLLEEKITGVQISGTTFPMTVTTSSGNVYTIAGDGNVEGDKQPGLYQYGKLVKTWQQLKDEGKVNVYSGGSAFISGLEGDLIISDEVTSFSSFENCDGLTGITIPSSVTYIDVEFGFDEYGENNLKSIVIESGNPVYDSRNNCNAIIETSTNTLIFGCKNTIIPNSVTTIGYMAFNDCKGLTNITIPSSVTSIEDYPFFMCQNLASIVVESGNPVYDSRNNCNAIIETSTNKLIVGVKTTIIPSSVTTIGIYAFRRCEGLTSIRIPSSVTSIERTPFYECENLESIVVESGNLVYDSRNNCNAIIETSTNKLIVGVKTTIIPSSVTSIGDYAFFYCSGLTSITIPNSVTSIGKYAFFRCTALTDITIPSSVTSIGDRAFASCNSLTSITIPSTITSIEDWAFSGCEGLTSITIQNGVTSIGNYMFQGCKRLTSVTIPSSVTSIGNQAFFYCSGLTSVTVPSSVTSIGNHAFKNLASGSKIYVPNSTVQNRLSDKYTTSLTQVVIDASKF